jgi:hypothetical protein
VEERYWGRVRLSRRRLGKLNKRKWMMYRRRLRLKRRRRVGVLDVKGRRENGRGSGKL